MFKKKLQITLEQVIEITDLYSKIISIKNHWYLTDVMAVDERTYNRYENDQYKIMNYSRRIGRLMRDMGLGLEDRKKIN